MIFLNHNRTFMRYIITTVVLCFSMNITVSAALLTTAQSSNVTLSTITVNNSLPIKPLSTLRSNLSMTPEANIEKASLQAARLLIQQHLLAYGVPLEQVRPRLNAMTNAEIIALSSEIDELPAGGDALTIIAFVFLVLLFTDIAGYTDLFPFVKKTTQTKTHDGQVNDRRRTRNRSQPIVIEN